MKKVALITGSAGFIGFHLSKNLLLQNWVVVGIDMLSNYYDVNLKKNRHKILRKYKKFYCYEDRIQNDDLLDYICDYYKPNVFIHLAAQAGVRYSRENPASYVENNLVGTFHVLEMARKYKPKHLLISSTSSIYGDSVLQPFCENQKSDYPISFYAATKKSNEVMAHSYSHLYNIPTTIFRFFTVYGPWGRPDMALFNFTKNILDGKPIDIYNYGNMKRDFTNVNDVVEAIILLINVRPIEPCKRKIKFKFDNLSDNAPYRIVNIGNSKPIDLMTYIQEIEKALERKAKKNFIERQDGDLLETSSDINLLQELTGFCPKKSIDKGIKEFVKWYKKYYKKT